jgi:hypothetical protein
VAFPGLAPITNTSLSTHNREVSAEAVLPLSPLQRAAPFRAPPWFAGSTRRLWPHCTLLPSSTFRQPSLCDLLTAATTRLTRREKALANNQRIRSLLRRDHFRIGCVWKCSLLVCVHLAVPGLASLTWL